MTTFFARRRRAVPGITGALLILSIPLAAASTVIRVPSQQPTIQAGIDASVNGDTVLVSDGTYTGAANRNLRFNGRAIVLTSVHGPASTTIDAQNAGRVFVFDAFEPAAARVQGFTITHGLHATAGGGIFISNASPTLASCVITDNRTANGTAGTAGVAGGAGGTGGGVHVNSGSPVFVDCAISVNRTGNGGNGFVNGAGLGGSAGGAGGAGAGLYAGLSASVTLTRCLVLGNVTGSGGTGGSSVVCVPPFTCTTFGASGGQGGDGGGVFTSAALTAINCVFRANETGAGGAAGSGSGLPLPAPGRGGNGGAWNGPSSSGALRNCTLNANSAAPAGANGQPAGTGGGVEGTPAVSNSILWNNNPSQIPAGAMVVFSDVQGGYSGTGNLNANPLFAAEMSGDLRLTANSPCLDAGSNAQVPGGTTTDADGQPRIADGNGDQVSVVDMGAYEFPLPTDAGPAAFDCGAFCVESPAGASVRLQYRVDAAATVRIEILDVAGRRIRVLDESRRPAGMHAVHWDRTAGNGSSAAAGIYFAVCRVNQQRFVRKLVLLSR